MRIVTLSMRSLWVYKRRLLGAFLAVFLGVAFLAGTLMVSDTLDTGIDRLFVQAYSGTDISVRNATAVTRNPGAVRGPIDRSLLGRVARVPGVAVAEPVIQGTGQLLDRTGKVIAVRGPRIAGSWTPVPALNPYHIVAGHAPRPSPGGYSEVVVDRQVANQGHLRVGDTTGLLVPQRIEVRIVGIAKYGSADAFGGGSFTAFTFADAQRYVAHSSRQITSIAVRAGPGVSADRLRAAIQAILPRGVQAVTGRTLVQENISSTNQSFLTLFRNFLLTFAGVALVVSVFSIYNTFAIVAAQRAREAALLRAVGASRRQVLLSGVLEGLGVALIGSAAGLGGGLGIAILLGRIFKSGFGMPISGLVVTPAAAAIAVAVGVATALLACLLPAIQGSRTPPLAALREAAAESLATSRTVTGAGSALLLGGIAAVITGATLAGSGTAIPLVGLGAVGVLAGAIALGPVAARAGARLLGAPGARLRGVPGRLARRNAVRAPRRTARAAMALMLGVGVVTLFTVLAASLRSGLNGSLSRSLAADLVISSGNGLAPGFSPRLTGGIGALPQVARVTGIGTGTVLIDGASSKISIVSPDPLSHLLRLNVTSGSVRGLRADQLAVSTATARSKRWSVGTPVAVTYADGTTRRFTVGAVFDGDSTLSDYLMSAPAWTAHNAQASDYLILIALKHGVGPAQAQAAITRVAQPFGAPAVQTRQAYIDAQGTAMTTLLDVAYGMLAFAIVIALLGIGNTLSLSTYERTRELGLLRAVGATRGQLRAMVRWESLIVALFGTLLGLLVGLFAGWGLATAIARSGSQSASAQFAVPAVQLAVIVVIGAFAGVLAAVRPASRAARLDVLRALAYE